MHGFAQSVLLHLAAGQYSSSLLEYCKLPAELMMEDVFDDAHNIIPNMQLASTPIYHTLPDCTCYMYHMLQMASVMYIDTEKKFSSRRVVEMARAHWPQHFPTQVSWQLACGDAEIAASV